MNAAPDRLVAFANHPWARHVLREMGLPRPRELRRTTTPYQQEDLRGRRAFVAALPEGFAHATCSALLARAGATLAEHGEIDTLVADATGCRRLDHLRFLHEVLQPAVRRLADGGRMLLLAPGGATSPEAAACARATEGFVRSLAKELGRRGATANAAYLGQPALPGLAPVLDFFGSDRSAYVSGQALRLRDGGIVLAPAGPRSAVVTGAAAGIGAATARRLAAEGMHVLCIDRPEAAAALEAIAREVQGTPLALDITAADASQRLVDATRPGGVDVLVHNAGVTRDRTLARMSAGEWDAALAVNLRAVLAIDAALDAANGLRDGAREICLASISGIAGNAGQSNYAASKAGLIGYVAARAELLSPRGITVNAVAPGFIETAMTKRIPFVTREAGRRLNSLMQGGLPEDVAEAIAFLARPATACVSGQTLRVCGQSFLGA